MQYGCMRRLTPAPERRSEAHTGGVEQGRATDEPGGMKAPLTREGNAPSVPLTPDEAAEMRRESDKFDQIVADALSHDADYLHERYVELLKTDSTRISGFRGYMERKPSTVSLARWMAAK